jgi:hypothetical protein
MRAERGALLSALFGMAPDLAYAYIAAAKPISRSRRLRRE